MLAKEDFIQTILERGFYLAKNVLTPDFAKQLAGHLEDSIEKENAFHEGKDHPTFGALLNTALYGGPFLDLLENENFIQPFKWFIADNCIIYSYSSASVPPNSKIYTARIHVDSHRKSTDHRLVLGAMVFLTSFTEENGSPYYLAGSHKTSEKPDEESFYKNADKIVGEAGDVFYFDPLVWHTGSYNETDDWRHALTIGFCEPWMKQRFDFPRVLTQNGLDKTMTENQKHLLGFYSQPPVTYDDFYQNTYRYNQKLA